ncbi:ATP-binding protein [Gordonibacter massiliensis (ex Traore et al. 2017)]|uniref:Uncharacterized protein n=1 Tax=Gordonibacter massiliensis (ex Traore et al. 2017) TaxID=1841863 RepID=A0A842JI09_9ACTN|nr:ATP-binding protein [Gordonibacter massiliensis (ex Traore et al. 2017)]MBC2888710.1 hypothetical protein [Gordonibacter massiliensis (ex Traore et al. 2017)]
MSEGTPNGASSPAAAHPTQWQLESLQLVNWGGFDGYHRADFELIGEASAGATMITGKSGSGKSTLLDSYQDIIMPNSTRFNSASNSVGQGKARGDQERTVLTYLQGKTDLVYDSKLGEERNQLLRDNHCARWSAVVTIFINDEGERFSAAKLYYIKSGCMGDSDYKTHSLTANFAIDPRKFEAIAHEPFDKRSIKSVYDGIRIHDTVGSFRQSLYSSLNIGEHGDGAKAVELLARIQAGYQITTVDALFKELVLDEPRTFEAAQRAVEHFDDIEKTFDEIEAAQRKMAILASIPADKKRYDEALEAQGLVSSIGHPSASDSPFHLWKTKCELGLIQREIEREAIEKRELEEAVEALDAEICGLEGEIEETRQALYRNGKGALDTIAEKLDKAQADAVRRGENRAIFRAKTASVGPVPSSAAEYRKLEEAAARFTASFESEKASLNLQRDDSVYRCRQLSHEIEDLKQKGAYYRSHKGNIPPRLNEAREQIADITDLNLDDLPFVGELIDLEPEEERWRLAAETTLHGLARTMLIEKGEFERVSRLIDKLHLRARINFQAAKIIEGPPPPATPNSVASKLQFDETSRFTPWVRKRLTDPQIDAICVERAEDLKGDGLRVTINGQTRRRNRGAHGRNRNDENVIGFSNQGKLDRIRDELITLATEQAQIDSEAKRVEGEVKELEKLKGAYDHIMEHAFEEIDQASCQAAVEDLKRERERILASNDLLKTLEDKHEELKERLKGLVGKRAIASDRHDRLLKDAEQRIARRDALAEEERRVPTSTRTMVSDAQASLLEETRHDIAAGYDSDRTILGKFDDFVRRMMASLEKQRKAADGSALSARSSLEKAFHAYRAIWPDNDLGEAIDSYDDYLEILEEVRSQGLFDRKDIWLENMRQWVAEDLVPVSDAYEAAIREIEDRLEPINEILRKYPFGTAKGRLQIAIRQKGSDKAMRFRKELQKHASLATTPDIDDIDRHHEEIRAFMRRLRKGGDGTGERDALLDRRRQVTLSARATWPEATGKDDSVYTKLGEKSGGEVQELVAFILGSALLFRLGNETMRRPGFAPVILDEGFVKADEDFTERAVRAWRGFGFQLIVATPDGKVGSFAPHMDRYITITKDAQERSYIAPGRHIGEEDVEIAPRN